MTADQAAALLRAAKDDGYLGAYVVVSLTTGIRTEEARALRWDHVDLDGDPRAGVPPHMAVWRSVQAGSDTKTERSRRTLALPQSAVAALREQRQRQAAAQLAALIHQARELQTVAGPDTDAVEERGFRGRAEVLVDQVAALCQDRRRNEQRLIAASKPVPAARMMGIAAVGQGEQHVRVNNDHEPRTLPAEPLRQQFIHALGYVRATAVPDPDELRQSQCLLVLRQFRPERLQQPKRTRSLLLAQMSDKLLELLLRGHPTSVDSEQRAPEFSPHRG